MWFDEKRRGKHEKPHNVRLAQSLIQSFAGCYQRSALSSYPNARVSLTSRCDKHKFTHNWEHFFFIFKIQNEFGIMINTQLCSCEMGWWKWNDVRHVDNMCLVICWKPHTQIIIRARISWVIKDVWLHVVRRLNIGKIQFLFGIRARCVIARIALKTLDFHPDKTCLFIALRHLPPSAKCFFSRELFAFPRVVLHGSSQREKSDLLVIAMMMNFVVSSLTLPCCELSGFLFAL